MLLTFDIGNSRTKIGLFNHAELVSLVSFDTHCPGYSRIGKEALQGILNHSEIAPGDIKGIIIASVVPSCTKTIESVCFKTLKRRPLLISPKLDTGINILYKYPGKLGNDRLCNAVAAFQKYKEAVIVIDWGTATKFEVVDKKGNYLGGIIAPGLESSAFALSSRTALLPKIALEFPPSVIGRETVHCLQSGIMFGLIEMTQGMFSRLKKELGVKPLVIATGGFAPLLSKHIRGIDVVNPYLVLEGARIIYERSKTGKNRK